MVFSAKTGADLKDRGQKGPARDRRPGLRSTSRGGTAWAGSVRAVERREHPVQPGYLESHRDIALCSGYRKESAAGDHTPVALQQDPETGGVRKCQMLQVNDNLVGELIDIRQLGLQGRRRAQIEFAVKTQRQPCRRGKAIHPEPWIPPTWHQPILRGCRGSTAVSGSAL
jgi:hypothetical protein